MNPLEIHDPWSLLALIVLLAVNYYQTRQNNQIAKSTNGLVDKRVEAAEHAAHAAGVVVGIQQERDRINGITKAIAASPPDRPDN